MSFNLTDHMVKGVIMYSKQQLTIKEQRRYYILLGFFILITIDLIMMFILASQDKELSEFVVVGTALTAAFSYIIKEFFKTKPQETFKPNLGENI
jgi:cell division septal protein FtsQ